MSKKKRNHRKHANIRKNNNLNVIKSRRKDQVKIWIAERIKCSINSITEDIIKEGIKFLLYNLLWILYIIFG